MKHRLFTVEYWEKLLREKQAEAERLADMAAFYAKGMDEQHAEVERLQRSAKSWEDEALLRETNRADLQAEVERLRAFSAEQAAELSKRTLEVERLRAELANKHGGDGSVLHVTRESQDALYADRDRARAEVERLRRDYEAKRDALKEVERLRVDYDEKRKELALWQSHDIEKQREVERLREKNALLHKQVLGFEWRIRTGVWR